MTRCPLPRCPWATNGVCVWWIGNWCPNQEARENKQRRDLVREASRKVEAQKEIDWIRRWCSDQPGKEGMAVAVQTAECED